MPTKYVRYRQLEPEYDIPFSRVHLKRKVDAGEFPTPVHLGPNTIAWLEEDILAWSERIRRERDAKQSAARQRAAEKLAGKPASVGAQTPARSRHAGSQGQEPGRNNEKTTADTGDWGVSDARTATATAEWAPRVPTRKAPASIRSLLDLTLKG